MKNNCSTGIAALVACFSVIFAGCSSDNSSASGPDASLGGSSGAGGSSSGGKGNGGASTGGVNAGGSGGKGGAATGGASGSGGSHTRDGGTEAGSVTNPPDGGGDAGDPALIARGSYLVNAVALCSGCHTDRSKAAAVLGGNATFRTGLPAPNLTSDSTGLGAWTNAQIKRAFMDGVDDQNQPLSSVMPYQLFHNLTDADANAIVAYLRSLPHVVNSVGERTVAVTAAATPFALTDFPDTTLLGPDAATDRAAAEAGRYLVTSAAQCVRCHTPSTAGVLNLSVGTAFTGGAPNPTGTPANQFAPNITPDATGIAGWTPSDIVTLLKTGKDKAAKAICGPMAVGPAGGYGKLTDEDARAIGVYLTTIPAVANGAADPSQEPTCP